uniref:2-amino-4-hydroxy-6- hydroxymethyldihydropteridine diphosphokinase n=1 Tax=Alistipes sp. TaxID=1872444 RepID=UPI0040563909
MEQVVLITGGNRGERERLLERARQLIGERVGSIIAASSAMESEAWGFRSEGAFLNQVLVVECPLEPMALLETTQQIERELGRDRLREREEKASTEEAYASRTMDIDILFYGDRCINLPLLQVPHPRFAERDFVLRPLVEVIPTWRDPQTGRTIEEIWSTKKSCDKKLK